MFCIKCEPNKISLYAKLKISIMFPNKNKYFYINVQNILQLYSFEALLKTYDFFIHNLTYLLKK